MKLLSRPVLIVSVVAAMALSILLASASGDGIEQAAVTNPALTVTAISPQQSSLPIRISATGNIAAWEEASIGAEAEGLRLTEVKVNVGDRVKRGEVLATFAAETVIAELAEARAVAEEAAATLTEAQANAQRARVLDATGAMSVQQINQYVTAERAARAKLEAAKAIEQRHRLRLAQTQVLAPDDGLVSSRTATVGAVLPAGQELFRLIRKGRLEWRAEVASADLMKLSPGQKVYVTTAGDRVIEGRLRVVAPAIDTQTRNGLVYVDLPVTSAEQVRAGMFVRGYFETGADTALTLPQSAVLLRDGFSYVLRISPESKVIQTKVSVGRRAGDRIEITGGLDPSERVVESGGSFLSDGDLVREEPSGVAI
ncbi:efflux RND transporter periplasmic adaptor subunit [Steroidobacter flavus]|uniref:Efflux RND transporter periplasmic adaptor subunit n=1 Tax=Steroidobacter flavus TaxID=1842136 RepID=A0ABV8T2W0_9GAMM